MYLGFNFCSLTNYIENDIKPIKMSKERFTTLIITIALEEYKSMLTTELFESYEIIGVELYELIENLDNNTDNLDVQAYYRVAERLYNDDDYEDLWHDLL